MRITGFVGSPRRGGSTDALVGEVLRGAAEAGAASRDRILADPLLMERSFRAGRALALPAEE